MGLIFNMKQQIKFTKKKKKKVEPRSTVWSTSSIAGTEMHVCHLQCSIVICAWVYEAGTPEEQQWFFFFFFPLLSCKQHTTNTRGSSGLPIFSDPRGPTQHKKMQENGSGYLSWSTHIIFFSLDLELLNQPKDFCIESGSSEAFSHSDCEDPNSTLSASTKHMLNHPLILI